MQTTKVPNAETGAMHVVTSFDSYGELLDFAENRVKSSNSYMQTSRKTHNEQWAGSSSFEQALRIAHTGWQEGREKIKELSTKLEDKVMSLVEVPQLMYDVTGNDFDMGALMAGQPEHWYTLESSIEEGVSNKVLKLVYNVSTSGGVDGSAMIARGAVAAALVTALEYAGFRVEVWFSHISGGSNVCHEIHTCLKAADQPLEIDRLSFAFVHPSSLRRICFSVMEHSDEFMQVHDCGYGMPMNLDVKQQGDVYFGMMMYGESQWQTPEKATAWILAELKKQGVSVKIS